MDVPREVRDVVSLLGEVGWGCQPGVGDVPTEVRDVVSLMGELGLGMSARNGESFVLGPHN